MKPSPFDASASKTYAENAARQVPGYADLHRMVSLLLAEHVPAQGRVLALGAGGGQELKALADAHATWTFDAVDPSADMLYAAQQLVQAQAARVRFTQGYIADAADGPFDAATSILVFHFIPPEQRSETLRHIHHRLKPGAPLVLVHLSFPQIEPARSQWIARHVAFGSSSGMEPAQQESARNAISSRLTILSPQEDEKLLAESGFTDINLFYAGLSIKGWVARAA